MSVSLQRKCADIFLEGKDGGGGRENNSKMHALATSENGRNAWSRYAYITCMRGHSLVVVFL